MTEPLTPDDVAAAIAAATTDEEAIAIERRYTADTAEEDPGEVDDGHSGADG